MPRNWFGENATRFLKELEQVSPGELRGTALLLTIAADVYTESGALPRGRPALYKRLVEIWLAEAEKRGLNQEMGDRLEGPAKLHVCRLAHVALKMLENPRERSLEKLGSFAAEYLRSEEEFSRTHAAVFSEKFIEVMARRSGVLVHRGETYEMVLRLSANISRRSASRTNRSPATRGSSGWSPSGRQKAIVPQARGGKSCFLWPASGVKRAPMSDRCWTR